MPYSLLAVIAAGLLTLAAIPSAFAQRHEIPLLKSCIKEFYDPEMYKWLTFQNTCSESLTVTFFAKDQSGVNGTMDLRPGAKDSVGRSEGKIPKLGSFDLYVCQIGYIPVDDNNKPVTKADTAFHCQQKQQ